MKTILLILALSGSLSAEVGVSLYTNGISKGAADARYVLRNPYYDGSQSVTVSSLSVKTAADNVLQVESDGGSAAKVGSWNAAKSLYKILYLDGLTTRIGRYSGGDTVINESGGSVSMPSGSFSVGTSTLVVKEGKVGVGTAVSANYLLNVGGDINIGVSNGLYSNGRALMYSGATGTFIKSYDSDASDGIHFLSNTGNAERMFIREDGNVGIGTTAPQSKLHVAAGLVTISTATTSVLFTTFGGAATKEELIALAPSKLFQYMTCTDCPTATLVCSTGTSAGNWADAADKTATPW